MDITPRAMGDMVSVLSRFPGMGKKAAQRMALHMLFLDKAELLRLSDILRDFAEGVSLCPECNLLTDGGVCPVCSNDSRDRTILCVVEKVQDAMSIEGTGEYRGLYHVLHGRFAPLEGKRAQDLRVSNLASRIAGLGVREVVIATGLDVEGDATAMYVSDIIGETGVEVTRPAVGMPVGTDVEYADPLTLLRAIRARRKI